MTPDVNVLVAAPRSDHPHHELARAWLEQALMAPVRRTPLTLWPQGLPTERYMMPGADGVPACGSQEAVMPMPRSCMRVDS